MAYAVCICRECYHIFSPYRGLKKAELQLASLKDQKEKVVRKLTALKSKADNQKANCEALREAREEVARETEQLRHQLALAVSTSINSNIILSYHAAYCILGFVLYIFCFI